MAVDVHPGREQRSPAYLTLNPRGTLPILVDGELGALREAEAILAYLARAYDPDESWLPPTTLSLFGQVMMWLVFASARSRAPPIARGCITCWRSPADAVAVSAAPRAAFRIMEDHMTEREFGRRDWFVGDGPTVADIALFPGDRALARFRHRP